MNRREYMDRLEQLLLVLPIEEREEALQYYEDYFDDAGMENEADVIRELGTPEEVAAKIRVGYAGEYAEYSEQGYEDVRFENAREMTPSFTDAHSDWSDSVYEAEMEDRNKGAKKPKGNNTNIWKIIAIALIVLIAGPVVIPLGIALIAVIFSIIIAILAVVVTIGISGFAIAFAGVVIVVNGIAKAILAPATGILATGIGCILLAVGIMVSWVIILLAIKVVPGFVRGIVNLLGRPFRKAGAK